MGDAMCNHEWEWSVQHDDHYTVIFRTCRACGVRRLYAAYPLIALDTVSNEDMRQIASRIAQTAAQPEDINVEAWAKRLADDVADAND